MWVITLEYHNQSTTTCLLLSLVEAFDKSEDPSLRLQFHPEKTQTRVTKLPWRIGPRKRLSTSSTLANKEEATSYERPALQGNSGYLKINIR